MFLRSWTQLIRGQHPWPVSHRKDVYPHLFMLSCEGHIGFSCLP